MDELLDISAAAARLGISVATWQRYRQRPSMRTPAPDRMFGRSPVWLASSLDAWQAQRRGRGWRKAA